MNSISATCRPRRLRRACRRGVGRHIGIALFLALLVSSSILALDKSGVSANTVSLPSGPGSIEGLGAAFEPDLNGGTGSYAFPLTLPPGPAGHTPSLVLSYDGGNGNGVLGIGWRLHIPFLQRRTHKGIPRYVDGPNGIDDDYDGVVDESDEVDVFVDGELEELVPVGNSDGIHTDYFRRHEGMFVRYRRVGNSWEGRLPDGTLLEFGLSESGRITDQSGTRIFRWMLERSTDTSGNTILFSYTSTADQQNLNQVYLKEIRYGPGSPHRGGRSWPAFHFVHFHYETRPDWAEDCRPGFPLRTGIRLKRIAVGTQGVDLAAYGHAAGDFNSDGEEDCLNRAYALGYRSDSHWSLLASITLVGADNSSALPAVTFTYTTASWEGVVSAAEAVTGSAGEPLHVMDLDWVELVDFNGDGLADILRTDPLGGPHEVAFNLGETASGDGREVRWTAPVEIGGDARAWSVSLDDDVGAIAHLADMDGDGVSDLVLVTATDTYCFANEPSPTAPAWGTRRRMALAETGSAPPAPFGSADVKTADVDFDKRIDIIQSIAVAGGARYRMWLNLDGQRYSRPVTSAPETGFMFSDTGVHIADWNGDRVPDIVRVKATELWVTPGYGYGAFGQLQAVPIPDWTLNAEHVEHAVLEDITGDGLADLVIEHAATGQLWLWVNQGNYTLGSRCVITGLPTQFGVAPERRWADLNGNGTIDLVYADRHASPRIQMVDIGRLLGCVPTPHLLIGIDNGIGRRIAIFYATTTAMALADAEAGNPWPDPLPFPIDVVTTVTSDDTRGTVTATAFDYHNGYYHPEERRFCGFARVAQRDQGDEEAPSLVSRYHFHTGKDSFVMRGKLLDTSVEAEDGQVFHTETTTWAARELHSGLDGRLVRFAHPIARVRQVIEGGHGESRRIESEYEYDEVGNPTVVRDYGVVVDGDRGAFGDERITETDYAYNLQTWLLRFPSRTARLDIDGTVISREAIFYDDPTFSGSNSGEVTEGKATLVRRWVNPAEEDDYVDSVRTQYDSYGNPVALLDPLASASGGAVDDAVGHYRTVTYDDLFHTYPVSETVHLDAGAVDLVMATDYDAGFGVVTASADPNRHTTAYAYDTFGRLTHIRRPGDQPGYPSTEYEVVLAAAASGESARQNDGPALINWIETRRLDQPVGTQPAKRDHYLISRQFVDGAGRTVMKKSEGEVDPGTGEPRVVIDQAVRLNARGTVERTLNPCYTMITGDLDAQLAFEDIAAPGWQSRFHENGDLVDLALEGAHATHITYDATLRSVQVTHADGTASRTGYEPLGRIVWDENDTTPTSEFYATPTAIWSDGRGRMIRVDETVRLEDDGSAGAALKTWSSTYQYRADDALTLIVDSQNNRTTFAYDGLGRSVALGHPDRGSKVHQYDAASNLIQSRDAKGQILSYSYDGANRLVTETDIAYHYDEPSPAVDAGDGSTVTAENTAGRLAWVQDLTGEEHISYDQRGREAWLIKRVQELSGAALASYRTSTSYDALDRVVEVGYPDGDRCTYEYNHRGLLERIAGAATINAGGSPWIIKAMDYAPSGQVVGTLYGNGVGSVRAYDSRLRLTELWTGRPADSHKQLTGNESFIHNGYAFDPASNMVAIHDRRLNADSFEGDSRRNTQLLRYDDLYRLTRVQWSFALPGQPERNDGETVYRHDRIGNMLAKTSTVTHAHPRTGLSVTDLGEMSYGGAQNAWNREPRTDGDPPGPHALTHCDAEDRSYAYDTNGNMTDMDGLSCTWDVRDRLIRTDDERMRAEIAYDYSGRRIWKRVWRKTPGEDNESFAGQTTYPSQTFEVRPGNQATKFVFNGSTRVAEVTGRLDAARNQRQRIEVGPGWNLVVLRVQAADAAAQIVGAPGDSPIIQALWWNADAEIYEPVGVDDALPARAMLWLFADRQAVLLVQGEPVLPDPHDAAAGIGAFGSLGPNTLRTRDLLADDLAWLWLFDSENQSWQSGFGGQAAFLSNLPEWLSAERAVFASWTAAAPRPWQRPAAAIRYIHGDHLGSATVITDGAGDVVDEFAYYPFGYPRKHSRPQSMRCLLPAGYSFIQKELDEESGLHYVEARYLASVLGRFASVDPLAERMPHKWLLQPQSLNPYSYCQNQPINFSDPRGEDRERDMEDILQTISGAGFRYDAGKKGAVQAAFELLTGKTSSGQAGSIALNCEGAADLFILLAQHKGLGDLESVKITGKEERPFFLATETPALGTTSPAVTGAVKGWEFSDHVVVHDPSTQRYYDPTFGTYGTEKPSYLHAGQSTGVLRRTKQGPTFTQTSEYDVGERKLVVTRGTTWKSTYKRRNRFRFWK